RIGRHPDSMTRVVLEAADIAAYSIYQLYGPYRLVIDCVRRVAPDSSSPRVPAPRAVPLGVSASIIWPPPSLRVTSAAPSAPAAPLARRTADLRSRRPPTVASRLAPIIDSVEPSADRPTTAEAANRESLRVTSAAPSEAAALFARRTADLWSRRPPAMAS